MGDQVSLLIVTLVIGFVELVFGIILNHFWPLFFNNLDFVRKGTFGWPLLGETLSFLKPHLSNSIGTFLQQHCSRLEPQRRCSEVIFASFKHELDLKGINWKSLSPETINMYFGEFKKQFYWDSSIDGVVRSLWEKRAADRYRDFISKRKSAGVRPRYVKPEIWNNWMELWKDPKCVEKSETASRNQCGSGNGVAVGTHTGGSVSIGEYRKRLPSNCQIPY